MKYEIALTDETKKFLSGIRNKLKKMGYDIQKSRCDRCIGGSFRLKYTTEYFIKKFLGGTMIFEIEQDQVNQEIITRYEFKRNIGPDDSGYIRLADVLDMAK